MKYLFLILLTGCTDIITNHYKNDSSVVRLESFRAVRVCRNKTIQSIDTCVKNVGCYGLATDNEYIGPLRENVKINNIVIFCSIFNIESGNEIDAYQQY